MTNKTEKGRTGRPTIVVNPQQVEKLASRWMTKEAIADFLGIHRTTLHEKMKSDPELEDAYLRGRASLQLQSMDWLISSAKAGSVRAQIFLAERLCGLKEHVVHEGQVETRYVVELPAEVPAMDWQQTFAPNPTGHTVN